MKKAKDKMYTFSIRKSALESALLFNSYFLAKPTTNLMLSNYHLIIDDGILTVETFDGNSGYRCTVDIVTDDYSYQFLLPGSIIGSGRPLIDMIMTIPETDFIFYINEELTQLEIKAGEYQIKMQIQDSQDYPNLDLLLVDCSNKDVTCDEVDTDFFADMVRRLSVAASTDETKSIITGICFQNDYAWATDGHKLSWVPFQLSNAKAQIVIPKPKQSFDRLMAGTYTVEIRFDLNGKLFQLYGQKQGHYNTYFTRVIAGEYPKCQQILDNNSTSNFSIKLSRIELLRNVEFLSNFDKDKPIIIFNPLEDTTQLELLSKYSDNQGRLKFSAIELSGNLCQFALNGVYLKYSLKELPGDVLTITGKDRLSPLFFTPQDVPDKLPNLKTLIMPVQVNFNENNKS